MRSRCWSQSRSSRHDETQGAVTSLWLRWLPCLALVAGCSYEWNALRPLPSFPSDVVGVDANAVDAVDAVVDEQVAMDVVGAKDAPSSDAPEAAVGADATDVTAPQDLANVDVIDAGRSDAVVTDVVDAPAPMDRPDVVDVPAPMDRPDVVDVPLPMDRPDVVDVPAVDIVDVPVDTGPTCTGLSCPCHPGNANGYCLVGQRCVSGACASVPAAGALVITEIMNDPNDPIAEPDGEWIEVYNPAPYAVDLRGMRVRDASTGAVITSSGPALLVLPLAYAVLARSPSLGVTGGPLRALATYDLIALNNSGSETITLSTADGTTIDVLTYGAGWPSMGARSKSLRPGILDPTLNDVGTNWCAAGTVYDAMHFGTPGAPNSCM